MFWKILEIEPTADKKKITDAYRKKLIETNPEDKPEEFKALREAYEQALAYAENDNAEQATPIDIWKRKLNDIYFDFPSRLSNECWEELFDDPICRSLDKRGEAENALLGFLMDNYNLPHDIMIMINDEFGFTDRIEELYESYPKDFVDYVIVNGVTYDETLNYRMFKPGLDAKACDQYTDLFLRARREENAEEIFQQMKALPESHPYGEALMIDRDIKAGNDRLADLEKIVEECDYEKLLSRSLIGHYLEKEEYEKAENVCNKALETRKGDEGLRFDLAKILAGEEKYIEAIDIAHDLIRNANGDDIFLEQLTQERNSWNEELIKKCEAVYENPHDSSLNVRYAWALLQNGFDEKADEVGKNIVEEETDPFDYYNIMSSLDMQFKRDKGFDEIDKLIEIIRGLPEDGDEKTRKRKARLAEIISRKAYYLCSRDRKEEGLEAYKEALKVNPENADVLIQAASSTFQYKKYEDTIEYAKAAIRSNPSSYYAYYLLAYAYFKTGNDSQAYESVNRSIAIYGSFLGSYILKLLILIRNDSFDAARELIKFLDESGCSDDLSLQYVKAQMVEFADKDEDAALKMYEEIAKKIEEGGISNLPAETYYRYLVLLGAKRDANINKDRDEMLEIAEKGLKYDPELYGLLDYKAWLLMKADNFEESLKIYRHLEENPNHSPEVEYQIGLLCYNNSLEEDADKVIDYLSKAIDRGYNYGDFELIYACTVAGRYDEAEKYCMALRKKREENNVIDIDSYDRMSYIFLKRKQYEEACRDASIALDNAKKRNLKAKRYYIHAAQMYRILGQKDKAIEVIEDMRNDIGDEGSYLSEMTNIYMQFGDYNMARKIVSTRLSAKNFTSVAAADSMRLYLLEGNILKANFSLANNLRRMDEKERAYGSAQIAEYEGRYKDVVYALKTRVDELGDKVGSYDYVRLAEAYLLADDEENAVKYAEMALEKHKDSKYSLYKPLEYTELARIYIIMKRFAEAEELLDKARNDMCAHCNYSTCKDADIFELYLLMRKGLYDEARAKCDPLIETWKDDEDFITLKRVLEKKKKK